MSNNNFSSFDFMFSDNPNKGIFEALDTYKTPEGYIRYTRNSQTGTGRQVI
jgi:hypothetical protein